MIGGFRSDLMLRCTAVGLAGLGGCTSTTASPDGLYAHPIGNAPVTDNSTPYTGSLECLAAYAEQYHVNPPSIAVGRISDLTGKLDDNGGRTITQGAMLMAISALGKAGVPLVERYETDVLKLEYKLADAKLIGPDQPGDEPDYEPIQPGQMAKASYLLTGGVTELNTNIQTVTNGLTHTDATHPTKTNELAASRVVMNIGIDLRLVDSRSTRVVQVVSYQKQIVGAQVGVGLYTFFGSNTVSIGSTKNGQEPVHYAVRTLLERAIAEVVARMYHAPTGACIDPLNDPLADRPAARTARPNRSQTASAVPALPPAIPNRVVYAAPPPVYVPPQPAPAPPEVSYARERPAMPPSQPIYGAVGGTAYGESQPRRYLSYPAQSEGEDHTPPYARQRVPAPN